MGTYVELGDESDQMERFYCSTLVGAYEISMQQEARMIESRATRTGEHIVGPLTMNIVYQGRVFRITFNRSCTLSVPLVMDDQVLDLDRLFPVPFRIPIKMPKDPEYIAEDGRRYRFTRGGIAAATSRPRAARAMAQSWGFMIGLLIGLVFTGILSWFVELGPGKSIFLVLGTGVAFGYWLGSLVIVPRPLTEDEQRRMYNGELADGTK